MRDIHLAIAAVLEEVASGLEERVEYWSSTYATGEDAGRVQVLTEIIDELRRVGVELTA
ncbi:hypothetical protein [Streptomyces sp. NRRL F-4489]|uniref:hypothetical protein n=1 Tax=Streptomyces sp. NRRL F-4489 TaxID=1609095 RepID=UPI000AD54A62|nr:hypothetical protein [Streptomyces sp. NRRL F-4489]